MESIGAHDLSDFDRVTAGTVDIRTNCGAEISSAPLAIEFGERRARLTMRQAPDVARRATIRI